MDDLTPSNSSLAAPKRFLDSPTNWFAAGWAPFSDTPTDWETLPSAIAADAPALANLPSTPAASSIPSADALAICSGPISESLSINGAVTSMASESPGTRRINL